MFFDVVAMLVVVAQDEQCPRLAAADTTITRRLLAQTASPPATRRLVRGDLAEGEMVDIAHHGAFDLQRVVLLGRRAEVAQMVGREVDAADERGFTIDHDNLAMHAAEHVEPATEQALARVEHVDAHADLGHLRDEVPVQVS